MMQKACHHGGQTRICTRETEGGLDLRLTRCAHVCRYHKYPRRTAYSDGLMAPKGLCIDLFHSAYPACLSLLYSPEDRVKSTAWCPNPEANVSVETEKRPTKTRALRRLLVKILGMLGHPTAECPDSMIVLTIRTGDAANCPCSHSEGQEFKFNIWLGRELCPATFDAVYPSAHNLLRGGGVPWSAGGGAEGEAACPDPKGRITMSIKRTADPQSEKPG